MHLTHSLYMFSRFSKIQDLLQDIFTRTAGFPSAKALFSHTALRRKMHVSGKGCQARLFLGKSRIKTIAICHITIDLSFSEYLAIVRLRSYQSEPSRYGVRHRSSSWRGIPVAALEFVEGLRTAQTISSPSSTWAIHHQMPRAFCGRPAYLFRFPRI